MARRRRRIAALKTAIRIIVPLVGGGLFAVACSGVEVARPPTADVRLTPVGMGAGSGTVRVAEEAGGAALTFDADLPVAGSDTGTRTYWALLTPGGCDPPADARSGRQLLPLFVGANEAPTGGRMLLRDATLVGLRDHAIIVIDQQNRPVLCGTMPAPPTTVAD